MCFSATASFIAGVSLSALGAATVKKAELKAEIPFAMIPLLFGVQQIIEGMLWLSFRFDTPLLNVTINFGSDRKFDDQVKKVQADRDSSDLECRYHLFAPSYDFHQSDGEWHKHWPQYVREQRKHVRHGHMVYVSPHFNKVPVMALYLAATCVSCFFSSHKIINIFGILALLLFMVAYWFYTVAFFSVWCFFAAILSVVIYVHFKFENERAPDLMRHHA